MSTILTVRDLGLCDYLPVWRGMRQFTEQRLIETGDELWLVEHPPVFTLGQAGDEAHILHSANIPVLRTDRGGQVTYHGPGQIVAYVLIDLRRKGMSIRQLVSYLEQIIIDLLAEFKIKAENRCDAPGVYIEGSKICSIGLRVKKGCTYHGIAFNFDMDLLPFSQINPCGFSSLTMTQLKHYTNQISKPQFKDKLIAYTAKKLGYTSAIKSQRKLDLLAGVHNV